MRDADERRPYSDIARARHRSDRFAHFIAAFAAGLLLTGGASAQESPFIPDGFGGTPAPAAPASSLDRFQFGGVMTIGAETFVTVVDTTTSKSILMAIGDTVDGLRVTDFRPDDGTVQIESGGQTKRVKLREAKIVAMATPPPPPMSPPGPPQGPQPGGPPAVAGAPISDEEARVRMQRVAEEIRRRREMRRQMLESQQQQQPRPANQ